MIIAVTYTTYAAVKLEPEKDSGLKGIRTHNLCSTGTDLNELSYRANWEMLVFEERGKPEYPEKLFGAE